MLRAACRHSTLCHHRAGQHSRQWLIKHGSNALRPCRRDGPRRPQRLFASGFGATAQPPVSLSVAVPTGLLSGVLGSLAGIGGGLVIIPALKQFTRMSQHHINGTALLAGTMACSMGAATYLAQGVANLPAAGLLVSFSVLFTQAGGAFAHSLPSHLLARVMGVVIICMVPVVLFLGGKKNKHGDVSASVAAASSAGENSMLVGPLGPVPDWTPEILRQRDDVQVGALIIGSCGVQAAWAKAHILIPTGVLTGFASGAFGIGGGIVMTAALGTAVGMSQHEAVATSLCAIVPTGLAGSVFNYRKGAIDTRAAAVIGGCSMAAMALCAGFVTASVPDKELRYVLATVMGVSGADMIRSSLSGGPGA